MYNKIFVSCQNNKAYSPNGVRKLFEEAEKENNGNLEIVFNNKNKYRKLIEMYHANFLALALYKKFGSEYKFNIGSPEEEPPDFYFIQSNGNGAFPVEVMELYKYKDTFKSYKELVNHIWAKKGTKKYEKCYLLLASRLNANKFNVTKFIQEFNKYTWDFQRIYFSFYTAKQSQWTFFEIFPPTPLNDKVCMYFNLNEDKKFWY